MAAPLRKVRASASLGDWLAAHLEAVGFWYLAAAYLLPVWAFAYLPTQDGPSHLANAEMILHYGAGAAGAEAFFIVCHTTTNLSSRQPCASRVS
jgi:hypothetical protein